MKQRHKSRPRFLHGNHRPGPGRPRQRGPGGLRLLWCLGFCLAVFAASLATPGSAFAGEAVAGEAPGRARSQAEKSREREAELRRMIGAMIMMGFRGERLNEGDPFLEAVREGKTGHVVLFDKDQETLGPRNIISPDQVRELTATLRAASSGPLLVAVDQEGGSVRRLKPVAGFMDLPSAQSLGRGSPGNTQALAHRLGQELAGLGINVDLAPVADVDVNPDSPAIGRLGRSFSADPGLVSQQIMAFGRGLEAEKVIPVLKHFPGHGSSSADTHNGRADITSTWNSSIELKPYVDAFRSGWPGMVMTGHLIHSGLDPRYPASLSQTITTGLLRGTLGWNGVVITDDLQMQAVTDSFSLEETILLAVNAGADILLFGNNLTYDPDLHDRVFDILYRLVKDGTIKEDRIMLSWQRITGLYFSFTGNYIGKARPSMSRIR